MNGKRKRAAAIAAAAILTVSCLCGCGKKDETSVVSATADGVLTVGIINGQDAFAKKTEDAYTGMEPDIMNRLAQNLGVSLTYTEAADTEELMGLLSSGAIDVAAGRLPLMDRYSALYLASRNYAKSGLYLVTRKNRYVDTLAGYTDTSVGVMNTIPVDDVLRIPYINQIEQVECSDISTIPGDIEDGLIEACICTEREALALMDENVQISGLLDGPRVNAVFYMQAGQTSLQGSLNQAINAFLDDQATGGTESEE